MSVISGKLKILFKSINLVVGALCVILMRLLFKNCNSKWTVGDLVKLFRLIYEIKTGGRFQIKHNLTVGLDYQLLKLD